MRLLWKSAYFPLTEFLSKLPYEACGALLGSVSPEFPDGVRSRWLPLGEVHANLSDGVHANLLDGVHANLLDEARLLRQREAQQKFLLKLLP